MSLPTLVALLLILNAGVTAIAAALTHTDRSSR